MSIYLAIELSLRDICARARVRALMTLKSCAVGMRNAKNRESVCLGAMSAKMANTYIFRDQVKTS